MRKKILHVFVIVAFVCTSLLLMSACAKKQVQTAEGDYPQKKPYDKMKVEGTQQKKEAEAKKVEMEDSEAYREMEAKRQARLRELEAAQKLANEIRGFESEHIYFDFDKSDLKPEAQAALKKKAVWLREHPEYWVRVEGHCDERGTSEYNLALGERRSHSARKFLTALGIDGDRIPTISYGEERPADPRSNETAWSQNRRDEFKLIKKR